MAVRDRRHGTENGRYDGALPPPPSGTNERRSVLRGSLYSLFRDADRLRTNWRPYPEHCPGGCENPPRKLLILHEKYHRERVHKSRAASCRFRLLTLCTIKRMLMIRIRARISRAQLRKNCSGRIWMISSVSGSKIQLDLPGKNTLWKVTNKVSKETVPQIPSRTNSRMLKIPV